MTPFNIFFTLNLSTQSLIPALPPSSSFSSSPLPFVSLGSWGVVRAKGVRIRKRVTRVRARERMRERERVSGRAARGVGDFNRGKRDRKRRKGDGDEGGLMRGKKRSDGRGGGLLRVREEVFRGKLELSKV
ncbi:hypothetical protein E2C01_046634 [Portunus trituberculatus]|uniref:Uncharacterized protein n=1 Tax=Portunus trituberculatus TaxID=210409 RepID=A0A5B7G6P8_PORTR|nr:hypothetical protein [Portunus trituberculatus]